MTDSELAPLRGVLLEALGSLSLDIQAERRFDGAQVTGSAPDNLQALSLAVDELIERVVKRLRGRLPHVGERELRRRVRTAFLELSKEEAVDLPPWLCERVGHTSRGR